MASTGISFEDAPAEKSPAVGKTSTGIKFEEEAPSLFKQPLEQAAVGYRPMRATPEQRQANIQRDIESFGWSPERVGSVGLGEAAGQIAKGAGIGAATMGGLGLFTGPGAIPMAGIGALGGAVSGGAEALTKTLGFGPGMQAGVGMAVPTPGSGVSKALPEAVKKYGGPISDFIGDIIAHKTLGWHGSFLARQANKLIQRERPIDVGALEKATGVEAAKTPMAVGETKFQEAARDKISQQYGIPAGQAPESALYESAKKAYDLKPSFVQSPEFQQLITNPNTGQVSAALKNEYSKIFVDEKKALRTGQQVIEKMKEYAQQKGASDPAGVKRLQDAVDAFLPEYKQARQAAEEMFVAKAKDELPAMLENSRVVGRTGSEARNKLRDNIQNYAKTQTTSNMFLAETSAALKNMNVADAKRLWGSIGPEVRRYMIKDPAQYQEITRIMNGARTPQEISRAARMITRIAVGFGASEE